MANDRPVQKTSDQSLIDDTDFLQKFIDEGKPLPAGKFVIRKPLFLGGGAYIVAGPATAAKDDVSNRILRSSDD
jgi:hypothetical protein